MRILVVGDKESQYYWDFYREGRFDGIDLIISCGDLEPSYLEFLVTFSNVPVLYVHGNHDTKYDRRPPEGCICIDDTIYIHNGVRILGLGGSMYYSGGNYQYTERDMASRIRKLRFKLFKHKGVDILVTHAPAYEINDGQDFPHQGFESFRSFLDKYKPKFFLHGHVHMNYGKEHKRYDKYGETHIINAYERCIFDYEDEHIEAHIS